jgi:uracil-DNA glycosylase family 4
MQNFDYRFRLRPRAAGRRFTAMLHRELPDTLRRELCETLRHSFGDVLDFPVLAPGIAAPQSSPAETLASYASEIRFCEKCSLHIGRGKLVFGRGHWGARIAFVGDFPSAIDDKKGEPFSDDAGELLNKMILAMKIKPEDAYLTNIFKCRPAAGDRPEAKHFNACEEHLKFQFRQIAAPVIVAMGEITVRALGRAEAPLQVLRKQVFDWEGRKVIPTHHPRDLQSSPTLKRETWEDLQAAMRELESSR